MINNPEINIDKFPKREKLEEIINELKSVDLSKVSYEKLFIKTYDFLKFFAIRRPIIAGQHIWRGRINDAAQIFYSERDISYRTDLYNIKKFGRANCPGQSLFYGAIPLGIEKMQQSILTNLFETNEMLREDNKLENPNSFSPFVLTVGRWKVKHDFLIADILFHKQSIESNSERKKDYEAQIADIKRQWPSRFDDIIYLLEFFADEFAKKEIKSHEDYKISVAYTEFVLNWLKLLGIGYPSVRTKLQGYNVALTIPAMENLLELDLVIMFKVSQIGIKELRLVSFAYATDLGPLKSNFNWKNIEGTSDEEINKLLST